MKKIIYILIRILLIAGIVIAQVVFNKPDVYTDLTQEEKDWIRTNPKFNATSHVYSFWREGVQLKADVKIGDRLYQNAMISGDFDYDKWLCKNIIKGNETIEKCIELTEEDLIESWVIRIIKLEYARKDIVSASENKTRDWSDARK